MSAQSNDLGWGKSVIREISTEVSRLGTHPNPSQEGNNLFHYKICEFKLNTDNRSLSVSPQKTRMNKMKIPIEPPA